MSDKIPVLDKGYVRLTETMGNDLTVANAARVSFDKESKELSKQDERIIAFLGREGHTSPFRHTLAQFEVYAPLMVARQWWKHCVGSDHTMDAWNESSRRYVTEEPEFYIPNSSEWRTIPEDKKQGSGPPLSPEKGDSWTRAIENYCQAGEDLFRNAMNAGIATEQARLFLPANGMYVRWRWTGSLQSIAHFINLRAAHDAQKEIQDYAKAVYDAIKDEYPTSLDALLTPDAKEALNVK